MWASIDSRFLDNARYYYKITSLLDRVYFYKSTFALQEALLGIENGDQEAFKNGLAGYIK